MLFYKVTAMLTDEKWCEENNDRRVKQERTRAIDAKSEDFNQKNGGEDYYFVSDIGSDQITGGIISADPVDTSKKAQAFFAAIKVKAGDIMLNEITLSSMDTLLRNASRWDFIDDNDEVLERFDLDRIKQRYCEGVEYTENLLTEAASRDSLYKASGMLLAEETLTAELDRIYSGKKNRKAFGHPVHYFIETDDRDTRKDLTNTLLQALYENHRLQSRRYCTVEFNPGQSFSRVIYDSLYKSCVGGTMVVRYLAGEEAEEDEYAGGELETVHTLCEAMMKYRNRVLTVFCLPRACEKAKMTFMENLGSIGMVAIKEDLADSGRACGYLKTLCRDRHIRPDKKLVGGLEAEKLYLPDELRSLFNEWYNAKMRTSVFPQYKDIQICRREAVKKDAQGTAYEKLREMVGLGEAKEVIGKALNYYKLQRLYRDKGIRQDRPAMHMVFTGNPGTAKTTAARLFARIMKENGLLSKGHLVEVGRGDLVGKYVGWTAQIVKDKFKAATGGVLFIDEAYALVEDRSGLYGDEAINTIVQEMENRREDLVVIFAGYPAEMECFLQKNPGLRSRIAFHIPFADYSTEELCEIARLIGKSKGVSFTEEAMTSLSALFETARQESDFGNGRFVRNVIECARMNQASRILSMDPDSVTDKTLTTIDAADIVFPERKAEPPKRRIGFAL